MCNSALLLASYVIYSTDGPAVRPERARAFGHAWGSRLTELESAGHIEPRSGFGPWDQGYRFVQALRNVEPATPHEIGATPG
jgi:predicted alpha/beta hydrolase family esterase